MKILYFEKYHVLIATLPLISLKSGIIFAFSQILRPNKQNLPIFCHFKKLKSELSTAIQHNTSYCDYAVQVFSVYLIQFLRVFSQIFIFNEEFDFYLVWGSNFLIKLTSLTGFVWRPFWKEKMKKYFFNTRYSLFSN